MPKAKADDTNFEIVEAGLHKARCIRMIDRGSHLNEQYGNWSRQFMAMFELPECKIKEGELAGEPFSVCLFFNLTIGENSKLRPLLVGWLGREFTEEEEEEGYEVFDLVNKPAYLNIIHNKDGAKVYANIQSIIPLKESECPDRIGELIKFDLDNFDQKTFDGFSEKMQKKIESSREWNFRFKKEPEAEKQADDELPSFEDPEVDIKKLGSEGARELIDFEKEYNALKPRTWDNVNDLCKRKMGEADYKDFFMLNEYGNPDTDKYAPEMKMQISKELIATCRARD